MTETAAAARDDSVELEVVDPERLRRFTHEVFELLGAPPEDAALMADYFVWVELHDLPFVGARRIPEFAARLREGGTRIDTGSDVTVVHEREGFALIDAGDTLAQLTGVRAMHMAVDKARTAGVGVVVVRNTTTAGALGYFAMLAAARGMIGLAINNSPAVMAAWGGSAGVLGAQPFAVASPAGRHPPLLLDMTNSVMSMVRMYESKLRGEKLPDGVALAADGEATRDPAAAIAGTLLPMGHRGYALALMWEVLTGVLGGGDRFGADVGLPADHRNPMAVSLFFMAIDPTAAMPYETFTARVDDLIDHMHASPTAPSAEPVRVPGERSQAAAQKLRESGIPMTADVVAALEALGAEVGVSW